MSMDRATVRSQQEPSDRRRLYQQGKVKQEKHV
jgi:hypothetical protein